MKYKYGATLWEHPDNFSRRLPTPVSGDWREADRLMVADMMDLWPLSSIYHTSWTAVPRTMKDFVLKIEDKIRLLKRIIHGGTMETMWARIGKFSKGNWLGFFISKWEFRADLCIWIFFSDIFMTPLSPSDGLNLSALIQNVLYMKYVQTCNTMSILLFYSHINLKFNIR